MTVQSRSTLKTYFITGSSPSESNFSDLIDSTLLVGDLVNSLASTSTVNPLTAAAGKILNDSITSLTVRVATLESQETDFASNYYTKTEVDTQLQAVDTVINSLTYQSQINDLQAQIDNIDVSGSSSASITIASVTGLQTELDTKASVAQLNDVRDSLIASINAIDTGGGTVDLSGINSSISALNSEIDALEAQLGTKADATHTHGDIYTKTEVDSLIDGLDLSDHTHVAADITDLGSEIQAKTNILVDDHANLVNNPHGVTKEQVGLGKVENLTPTEIIQQAGGVSQQDITDITDELSTHKSDQNNPHNVNKYDVGLGNVGNIDYSQLINDHLTADNPHNITLDYFDVYTTAESDTRMQFYIDALRYAFTPLSNDDSAGAIGDFGYDQNNLYFKIGSTEWGKLPFSPVYIERAATQEDVDSGKASFVGEIILVNETQIQSVTQINVTENFNITNEFGDDIFNITEEGDIIQNSTTIEGDITVQGDIISNENITINAPSTTINNLTVDGGNITNITNIETSNFSSVNIEATDAEITNVTVSNIINQNPDNAGQTADFNYDFVQNRWITDTPIGTFKLAYIADLPDLSNYALKSDIPSNIGGSDPDVDDGGGDTDIVLDGQTGGLQNGYAFTPGAGLYADDFNIAGEQEYWAYEAAATQSTGLVINLGNGTNNPSLRYDITISEWVAFNGTDTYQLTPYTKDEVDALLANYTLTSDLPDFSTFSLTADLPDFSTFALLTDLEGLGGTTIINEGDTVNTTVLNQTIVQQSLTVDGTTGGAENGYAYAEYDDGTGTLVAVKYSIDYGADNTFGTSDDDDAEDYFAVDASAYNNAGLTINAGLSSQPSIVYDGTSNKWLVDNGEDGSTNYGSFLLKDVDAAVSDLVDSAPDTLNTLNELAAALGDDANFATTTSTALGNRVRFDASQSLSSAQKTQARSNIGAQVAGSYAAASHNHDGRYYTEDEIDNLLKAITDNLYSA
jgi:hypothetical protein